jgi:hypothetical protein
MPGAATPRKTLPFVFTNGLDWAITVGVALIAATAIKKQTAHASRDERFCFADFPKTITFSVRDQIAFALHGGVSRNLLKAAQL